MKLYAADAPGTTACWTRARAHARKGATATDVADLAQEAMRARRSTRARRAAAAERPRVAGPQGPLNKRPARRQDRNQ